MSNFELNDYDVETDYELFDFEEIVFFELKRLFLLYLKTKKGGCDASQTSDGS